MKKIALFIAFMFLLFVGVSIATNPHTPRGPIIVADTSFLSQTVNLPSTTIFTPPETGLYRINAYGETSTNYVLTVSLAWQDSFNSNFVFLVNGTSGSRVIYCTAGVPITIDMSSNTFNSSSETFNLYITVEQL